MPNLRIISTNDSDTATLSSSDFVGTLPVTNLQVEGRARVARTTNATGNKTINGSWSSAKIVSAVVLYGCNFTSLATIRVQAWDGANQTGTQVYDSGVIPALDSLGWGEFIWGVDAWGASVFSNWSSAYSVLWLPQSVGAQSFSITVADAANPAGYIQIKRLLIGAYFEPLINADYGMQLCWQDNSIQTRTMAGSIRTDIKEKFRMLNGNLSGLSSGERATFFDMSRAVGLSSEIFVSAFPQSGGANERDHSMLCKFDKLPAITQTQYTRYSGAFSFVEV